MMEGATVVCAAGGLRRQGDLRSVAHAEVQCPVGCERRTDDRRVFDGDRRLSHQAGQPVGPLKHGRLDEATVAGVVMAAVATETNNDEII